MDRTSVSGWPRELCLDGAIPDHVTTTTPISLPHFITPFSSPTGAAIAEAPASLGKPQQVFESVDFESSDNGLVLYCDSNLGTSFLTSMEAPCLYTCNTDRNFRQIQPRIQFPKWSRWARNSRLHLWGEHIGYRPPPIRRIVRRTWGQWIQILQSRE
jgi:hypothetical protein